MNNKVLLVGDHPSSTSGNSGMMNEILRQIEVEGKYEASVFALKSAGYNSAQDVNKKYPYTIIEGSSEKDRIGKKKLLDILQVTEAKNIIFVGLDIWAYVEIFKQIQQIRVQRGLVLSAIFPFDIREVRKDWVTWMNFFDYPCVYSQYGYDSLKEHVPNLSYFRPSLKQNNIWESYSDEKKLATKKRFFPGLVKDELVFGFVGVNQMRKDPQKLIKAYPLVKKELPNSCIYFHCNLKQGVYNLQQYVVDCGYKKGWMRNNGGSRPFTDKEMVDMYNSLDVLVNCSIQEGLSWTPLEAMLCGCPVIGTETTSQTELIEKSGVLVKQTVPTYMPLIGRAGNTWMDAMTCTPEAVAEAMLYVGKDVGVRKQMREKGLAMGKEWLSLASDVNVLLGEMTKKENIVLKSQKIDKVLFVQHSSAGDVLMTTQCFKGLKERHPGKELVYMTQPQYMSIIEGNPYIDEIISWNPEEAKRYAHVYNPHSDKIAPGNWGRNANTLLADFYWKLLDVEPTEMFIDPIYSKYLDNISIEGKKVVLVHTTGGSKKHRTYKYMDEVCSKIREERKDVVTIQIGAEDDCEANADIDLRGKLSFRETAWIVKRAHYAITVDSFVSHLVGIFGIPQLCLFGTGNSSVVRPKQKENLLICLSLDYIRDCPGLGPCSGVVDCPHPCCIGIHSPELVYNIFKELMNDSQQSIVKFYSTTKKGMDYEVTDNSR